MGRQLRFYMVEEDEDEFIEFLRTTGDVVILPQATDKEEGEDFSTFRELAGLRLGEDSCIWNRKISPAPVFTYFPVHGGYYCLDPTQSEVVSVMRSKRANETLSMGRLYIDDKASLPDGSVVEKNARFVKWFNKLCRWIKTKYPSTCGGARLSSRAEALSKTGVELTGHVF